LVEEWVLYSFLLCFLGSTGVWTQGLPLQLLVRSEFWNQFPTLPTNTKWWLFLPHRDVMNLNKLVFFKYLETVPCTTINTVGPPNPGDRRHFWGKIICVLNMYRLFFLGPIPCGY
jgi:hypothetical protein